MANHEPVLTTLRPGILSVSAASGVSEYVVTGGFAEVTAQGVTVIAERAMAKADVTQEDMDGIVAGAAEAVERASEDAQEAARKMQSDVAALASALGLQRRLSGLIKLEMGPMRALFSFVIFLETKFLLHETHVVTHHWGGSRIA